MLGVVLMFFRSIWLGCGGGGGAGAADHGAGCGAGRWSRIVYHTGSSVFTFRVYGLDLLLDCDHCGLPAFLGKAVSNSTSSSFPPPLPVFFLLVGPLRRMYDACMPWL